jgi:hypothetical protein
MEDGSHSGKRLGDWGAHRLLGAHRGLKLDQPQGRPHHPLEFNESSRLGDEGMIVPVSSIVLIALREGGGCNVRYADPI